MTTLRQVLEPEILYPPAQRRNADFMGLDSRHYSNKKATNYASTQLPPNHVQHELATIEPAQVAVALMPRRTIMSDSNIEHNVSNPHHAVGGPAEIHSSLPPADTGRDAWLFLFSAFTMDILVWGIYLPYYALLLRLC